MDGKIIKDVQFGPHPLEAELIFTDNTTRKCTGLFATVLKQNRNK